MPDPLGGKPVGGEPIDKRARDSESAEESHGSFASIGARKEFGYQVFPLARGAR